MIKAASSVFDSIGKWMSENPTATTALLAGGAGALGGFALTGSKEGESTSDAMKRRLRNALIVGGLAGGGGAAIKYGLDQINTAMPDTTVKPGDPWTTRVLSTLGLTGAGAGAGTMAGNKIVNKLQSKDIMAAANQLGLKSQDVGTARKEIQNLINAGKLSEDKLAEVFGHQVSKVKIDAKDLTTRLTGLKDKQAVRIAKQFGYELNNASQAREFLKGIAKNEAEVAALYKKLGGNPKVIKDIKSLEALGDKLKRFGFTTGKGFNKHLIKGNKGFKVRGRGGAILAGAGLLSSIGGWLGNIGSAAATNDPRSLLDMAWKTIDSNTL